VQRRGDCLGHDGMAGGIASPYRPHSRSALFPRGKDGYDGGTATGTAAMKQPIPLDPAATGKATGGAYLQGGAGQDTMQGSATADVIFAGAGHDTVVADAGNDQVFGEAGNDLLHGGAGQDALYGGVGQDTLLGGSGQDQLYGEDGDDVLDGGGGDRAADLAYGGAGQDSYVWAPGDGNDQFTGGNGVDTLKLQGLSLADLQAALTLLGPAGLQMQVNANVVTITDAAGQPTSFSGAITHGGEVMRFYDIERIALG